jgi:hypothetical protein
VFILSYVVLTSFLIRIVYLLEVDIFSKEPDVCNETADGASGVCASGESKEEDFVSRSVVGDQPQVGLAYVFIEAPTSSPCREEVGNASIAVLGDEEVLCDTHQRRSGKVL